LRYLGIDYGLKRVGLAISSRDEKIVTPYKTLIKSSKKKLLKDLKEIIEKEGVEAVVVGLPMAADGSETLTTRQVKNFVAELKKCISKPIYLMDESYSSFVATSRLKEAGISSKKIKKIIDQVAAQDILTSYLNPKKNEQKN